MSTSALSLSVNMTLGRFIVTAWKKHAWSSRAKHRPGGSCSSRVLCAWSSWSEKSLVRNKGHVQFKKPNLLCKLLIIKEQLTKSGHAYFIFWVLWLVDVFESCVLTFCTCRWLCCSQSCYNDRCCTSSHWLWQCFNQSVLTVDFIQATVQTSDLWMASIRCVCGYIFICTYKEVCYAHVFD